MLAAQMNDMRMRIAQATGLPASVRLTASGQSDSSGNVWLGLGHAPQGRTWYVRNLVVGGPTWNSSATGTVIVAVTPSPPPADTQPSTNYIRDAIPPIGGGSSTLPGVAWYEAGQFPIREREGLYIYISTAASGTSFVAAATVDDITAAGSNLG